MCQHPYQQVLFGTAVSSFVHLVAQAALYCMADFRVVAGGFCLCFWFNGFGL